jgi:hypothetical protein
VNEFDHVWVPRPGNDGDRYPMWCEHCRMGEDYAVSGYLCMGRMLSEIGRLRVALARVPADIIDIAHGYGCGDVGRLISRRIFEREETS